MARTVKPSTATARFLHALIRDGGRSETAMRTVDSWGPVNDAIERGWATREYHDDSPRVRAHIITEAGRTAAALVQDPGPTKAVREAVEMYRQIADGERGGVARVRHDVHEKALACGQLVQINVWPFYEPTDAGRRAIGRADTIRQPAQDSAEAAEDAVYRDKFDDTAEASEPVQPAGMTQEDRDGHPSDFWEGATAGLPRVLAFEPPAPQPAEPRYSREQVAEAFQAAADAIAERVGADDDSGLVDALNLLINAGMHYLERPGERDLDVAIGARYEASPAEVVGWVETCL